MCYAVVKIVYFKVRINNRSSIFLVYFVKWISTLTSWILNITRKIKCCRNILKERAPVTCMIWLTFALIYCYKWPWGYLTSIWFSCLYSMKNKKKKTKNKYWNEFLWMDVWIKSISELFECQIHLTNFFLTMIPIILTEYW